MTPHRPARSGSSGAESNQEGAGAGQPACCVISQTFERNRTMNHERWNVREGRETLFVTLAVTIVGRWFGMLQAERRRRAGVANALARLLTEEDSGPIRIPGRYTVGTLILRRTYVVWSWII